MPKLPSISGERLVRALKRAGFVELRQKGSHVSLEKRTVELTFRTVVPHTGLWPKGLCLTYFARPASPLNNCWISYEPLRAFREIAKSLTASNAAAVFR